MEINFSLLDPDLGEKMNADPYGSTALLYKPSLALPCNTFISDTFTCWRDIAPV